MGHIYWIASYPKSGNTWVRSFLARLVLGTEGGLNSLWSFAPDEHYGAFYQPHLAGPVTSAQPAELAAVRPAVHRQIAETVEGFQFLKTHTMLARHAGTATITPEVTAGAIYVVRNPLDIALSYSAFMGTGIDETIRAMNTVGRMLPRKEKHSYVLAGSWSENVMSWTKGAHERRLVLRYEDLLSAPQAEFRRLVDFLGIGVTPERFSAALRATTFESLRAEEQANGFVERPEETGTFFRRGVADRWREELSAEQIASVVVPNRAAMTAMGYWEPDFDQILTGG